MNLLRLMTQTVDVVRRSDDALDSFGDVTVTWAPPVPVRARVEVETSSVPASESDGGDRDAQDHRRRLLCPADTAIGPYDRVVVDGQIFEVNGPPVIHRVPSGQHHLEAQLRWVQGA
jgi:hypothetical protein